MHVNSFVFVRSFAPPADVSPRALKKIDERRGFLVGRTSECRVAFEQPVMRQNRDGAGRSLLHLSIDSIRHVATSCVA